MIQVNLRNVRVGSVIVIDGTPRTVIAKAKAFKAPEWAISYDDGKYEQTVYFHANKKFVVVA